MNGAKAPDPFQTAMTQNMFNTQAAKQQQSMNMVDQSTPYGALSYTADPNSPSGYRATQTYTPEVQALLRGNIGNSQAASDTAGALLRNGQGVLSNPVDTSWNGTADKIANINKSFLDPLWAQRTNEFDQKMADRGIMPGSEPYRNAARDFGMQRDNSYNNMGLGAYTAGVNANLQQQASALNAMNALRNGSQIAQPVSQGTNFTTTPQESIQPVNYSQLVSDNYKNQTAQDSATMGGLFGLGGTVGSAAMKYAPQIATGMMMLSDERLKTDIKRVGTLDNGLPVYSYRYKAGGPHQIGVMAQDVEKVRPEAVHEIGGYKAVDYRAAAEA